MIRDSSSTHSVILYPNLSHLSMSSVKSAKFNCRKHVHISVQFQQQWILCTLFRKRSNAYKLAFGGSNTKKCFSSLFFEASYQDSFLLKFRISRYLPADNLHSNNFWIKTSSDSFWPFKDCKNPIFKVKFFLQKIS